MAISIVEALSEESPRGIKVQNESLEVIYVLVKLHMEEIEEAREHGYSWTQIENVCKKLWKSNAKCSKIIWRKHNDLVRSCYQAIKKGHTPKKILGDDVRELSIKARRKKYNIEVTES